MNSTGNTYGLPLILTKVLQSMWKVVILDNTFYILQGIIEIRKVVLFTASVINKRRYWPRHVPGQEIYNYIKTKEIGDVAFLWVKIDDYN